MALVEDIAAIAAINRGIPGVNAAYDSTNMPQDINVLPCALVIVAPGAWGRFHQDEFVIRVYVAEVSNGNPATAYAACVQLLDAFQSTYQRIASINERPLVQGAHGPAKSPTGLGSSGFYYTQSWSGRTFYGFEVFLPLGPRSPLVVPTVHA